MSCDTITPFLKWAGGKRWLTNQIPTFFPDTYNQYIEPFLGSGAIFFSLKPKSAILSDVNLSLIETYKAIQIDHNAVYDKLLVHSINHCEKHYYQIRSAAFDNLFDRAARFIYLNRTCFNGIYRVNLSGLFNVPKGSKEKVMLNTDNFRIISDALKTTEIIYSDFESIVERSRKDDLIYVDPPYTVKHNNNGFVKYNEKMFTWEDQERLCQCLIRANERGAKIVLSNADHVSIQDLYKKYCKIIPVKRSSVIASDPKNRGQYSEVVITFN